jgi:hypothetical protein
MLMRSSMKWDKGCKLSGERKEERRNKLNFVGKKSMELSWK